MADPPNLARVALTPQSTLDEDVPCATCDYSLRHRSLTETCPECGQEVLASLKPNRLYFAEPGFVRSLAAGLGLGPIGILTGMVMFVILLWIRPAMAPGPAATTPLRVGMTVWGLAMPPGLILALAAWWLTRPESIMPLFDSPGPALNVGQRRRSVSRIIARWAAVTTTLFALTTGILYYSLFPQGTPTRLAMAQAEYWPGVAFIAGCITVTIFGFSLLLYARSLALRIPAQRLARQTLIILLLYALVTLCFVIVFTSGLFLDIWPGRYVNPAASKTQGVIQWVVNIMGPSFLFGLFGTGIYTIVLATMYYRTLNSLSKLVKARPDFSPLIR